ncbi:MAG: hypothetical protein AB7P04_00885 [Bacteriovoracia bacterium]
MKSLTTYVSWLLIGMSALASSSARADWLHHYVIMGDGFYRGITKLKNGQLKDEEQSSRIRAAARKQARSDRENSYLIYWHVGGESSILELYRHGKRVYYRYFGALMDTNVTLSPVSRTDFAYMHELTHKHGLVGENTQRSLYFYGKHVADPGANTQYFRRLYRKDYSRTDLKMGVDTLAGGRPWDLLIVNSCFMNELAFLSELASSAKLIVTAEDAVLNSPGVLPISTSNEEAPIEIARRFQTDNAAIDPRLLRFLVIDSEEITRLKAQLGDEVFRFSADELEDSEGLNTGEIPGQIPNVGTGEELASLKSAITRLHEDGEVPAENLRQIRELLQTNPDLGKLRLLLSEPRP